MANKHILATDPRGLPVEMWDERWEQLIRKHPDLLASGVTEGHLADAIEHPLGDTIYWSNDYRDSELYYAKFSKTLMIRVVAKYVGGAGEVLTAHFVKRISGNVKVRWTKKNE